MTTENKPHIIVTGDPMNGFEFYGPFKDWDEACDMAEADDCLSESVWWCAPLETLTKVEELPTAGDVREILSADSISLSSASNR